MTPLRRAVLGVAAGLWAASVQGQLNRSAVSVAGDDANPCTPAAPCRTFTRAISQTNTVGEVVALTSGGYGPFTVSRSMTIQAAPGVYAGITAPSSDGIAVTAGAGSLVVLRGLTLKGLGSVWSGVFHPNGSGGGEVIVDGCVIDGFGWGITSFYGLTVVDTVIRDYYSAGVAVAGASSGGTVDGLRLSNDSNPPASQAVLSVGVTPQSGAHLTIRNVNAFNRGARNGAAFIASPGSSLNVENAIAANYHAAVLCGNGVIRASNVTATDNAYGFSTSGASSVIESWGNNRTRGNQVDVSAPAPTPVAFQ